jgi:argininosuccinate synthase
MAKAEKVVLAYSGGLDTSVILPWLKETYGYEVIAFAAELGQGDELAGIKRKALASGAVKCVVKDLRDEFVEDYLWPMLKSGAVYLTYMALDPSLKIIAPWKDPKFTLTSREAAVDYAKKHKIPIEQTKKKIYSQDRNLWHISHEGAELEDPANEPKDGVYVISRPLSKTPDKPDYVEVGFNEGVPVKLNGKKISGVKLIEQLNRLGGKHAIGQIDLVENRLVGIKSRGVYETPGGTILTTAHNALESLTLDRETMHYKQQISLKYADLVYYGLWFSQLREALDAFIDVTQRNVTGEVKMKLFKGRCSPAGIKSPKSLYRTDLASFKMGDEYDPTDADGFIRLFGLPMKVAAAIKKKKGK